VILIVAGILGPIIGFDGNGFLPGIVLLFIGRAMSKQARTQSAEAGDEPVAQRALNTVRAKTMPPPPRPTPPPRRTPPPPSNEPAQAKPMPVAEPKPMRIEPVESAPGPVQKQGMLESVLLAGSELADKKDIEMTESRPMEPTTRMTSDEMIAEARKKWGRRP
jgi:hypothetical protein